MNTRYSLAFLLAAAGWATELLAQSSSSGMFGSRSLGNSLSPGMSNFGGSSRSGSSFGMGQGGFGQSAFGQGGSQGSPYNFTNPSGVGGQARRAGSFVGANTGQQAQRNFVGAVQAGAASGNRGGARNLSYGNYGGLGSFGRRPGQNDFGANNARSSRQPSIRTTLALGFEPSPAAASSQVSSTMARHLAAMPALHWAAPPQVELQGRTAILRGVAATEHDRDLAERVVRLEATVDQVQNLLEVATPAKPRSAGSMTGPDSSAAPDMPALPALERTPAAKPAATGSATPAAGRNPPDEILPPLPAGAK
jgi:hypothetical protein